MSLEDARDLWMEVERLRLENQVLKDSLLEERNSVNAFFATTENERQAWQTLEDELNTELKLCKRDKYKWGFVGIVSGALIMAIAD